MRTYSLVAVNLTWLDLWLIGFGFSLYDIRTLVVNPVNVAVNSPVATEMNSNLKMVFIT